MKALKSLLAIVSLLTVHGAMSAGATPEALCTALGTGCMSSETLNYTSIVDGGASGSANWWHGLPQDTSDAKRFDVSFLGLYAQHWGTLPTAVASGFPGWNAIHSTTYQMDFEQSYNRNNSMTNMRIAARYYFRNSADYQTTVNGGSDPTQCSNDKYIQLGEYLTSWSQALGYGGWSSSAYGGGNTGQDSTSYPNHWVRIELVMDPYRLSPVSQYTAYIKDITANTPEVSFSFMGNLDQSSNLVGFTHAMHRYRAGTCAGSSDMMFVMLAAFPTGSSRRIGLAAELEGGGLPPALSPTKPLGLILH